MTNKWSRARRRARDYVDKIKLERGCEMCGYNEKSSNLQWHHVIPEMKYKAVAEIVSENRSIDLIDKEIEKCVCVCKACHGRLEM